MEYKKNEALYLVRLVSASLNGGSAGAPAQDIDWVHLVELAQRHKIESMIYVGLSQTEGVPEAVLDRFAEEYKRAIVTEYIQQSEGVRILRGMEERGIDCMPLKGWILKSMYPQPAMRSMCDIDVLIKKESAQQVRGLMSSMGYDAEEFGGNPDVYFKKPVMNVEVHNALLRDKTDHFDSSWDRAVLRKGCAHTYEMTKEDYYIYMSAHLRKHFFGSGTGVRSVADLWVYCSALGDKLDWEYIRETLDRSGLWEFDMKLRRLCRFWFGGEETDDGLAEFQYKVLYSAAYGTEETAEKNTVLSEINRAGGSRLRYILQLIFPGRAVVSERYPFVNKLPFLLPVAWIARGFVSVFMHMDNVKKALSNATEVNAEEIDSAKR